MIILAQDTKFWLKAQGLKPTAPATPPLPPSPTTPCGDPPPGSRPRVRHHFQGCFGPQSQARRAAPFKGEPAPYPFVAPTKPHPSLPPWRLTPFTTPHHPQSPAHTNRRRRCNKAAPHTNSATPPRGTAHGATAAPSAPPSHPQLFHPFLLLRGRCSHPAVCRTPFLGTRFNPKAAHRHFGQWGSSSPQPSRAPRAHPHPQSRPPPDPAPGTKPAADPTATATDTPQLTRQLPGSNCASPRWSGWPLRAHRVGEAANPGPPSPPPPAPATEPHPTQHTFADTILLSERFLPPSPTPSAHFSCRKRARTPPPLSPPSPLAPNSISTTPTIAP